MESRFLKLSMGIFLLAGVFFLARKGAWMVWNVQSIPKLNKSGFVVVIDPGHGGSDPGKIGVHDEKEKDINLQISMMIKKNLEEKNVTVVMTRETDTDLAENDMGSRKVQDLKKRCMLIDKISPDCAVSIHQNSYHEEKIRGAQAFYFEGSEKGKKLGEIIQQKLIEILADGNKRMAKGNMGYYMLKKTKSPLVIVECGFLSNGKEASLLASEEYQKKVAEAVSGGIIEYLGITD